MASASVASRPSTAYAVAATAVMTAVVTVFTAAIQVRNPASGGYFNLSDVAVVFAALAFGPRIGLVAGGLGAAIADLLLGYAQFAPLSLIAHGGEGFIAGWLAQRTGTWGVPAWLAGVAWMMAAYFLGELVMFGSAQAVADLVGTNWLQALAGVLGIALYYAVRAVYPPITRLREGRAWKEI
jgi:uncharacterized membrane protein